MMKKLLIALIGIAPMLGTAQDIHFSQFDISPMFVNPAHAGFSGADHRFVGNYRSQWASIGSPYRTYGFTYDGAYMKDKWGNAYLGGGLGFFNDVAGDLNLGITQVDLTLASGIQVNANNWLSVGVMGSYAQRSMDNSGLEWGNQYGATGFDPAAASNETMVFEPFNYMDVSAGIAWAFDKNPGTLSSNDALRFQAGVAMYHINQPDQMMFSQNDKLYSKITGYFSSHIGIRNSNMELRPMVFYAKQGPAQEIVAGLIGRYRLKEASKVTGNIKEQALYFGSYFRVGDAVIPTIRYEYAGISVGLSYDVNISQLNLISRSRGGFEVNLSYKLVTSEASARMVN